MGGNGKGIVPCLPGGFSKFGYCKLYQHGAVKVANFLQEKGNFWVHFSKLLRTESGIQFQSH